MATYMDTEGRMIEVCASLMEGTLERDVIVSANSIDGSAVGMYTLTTEVTDTCLMHHKALANDTTR